MRQTIAVIFGLLPLTANAQFYSTGLLFNDHQYAESPLKVVLQEIDYSSIPSSCSLKKFCPRPGNQLQLNTSASWAVTWSARTLLGAKQNDWTDTKFITKNAFSPALNYQAVKTKTDQHCMVGTHLYEVLEGLKSTGTVNYIDYLEFCPNEMPVGLLANASKNTISDYVKLFDQEDQHLAKIRAVKLALSEGFPVVTGMICPPSFHRAKGFWQPTETIKGEYPGHAVCVVGYDDTKYGGAFEILNSWGSEWGNEGYLWIRYDDFTDFTKYAYEIYLSDDEIELLSGEIELRLDNQTSIQLEKIGDGIFKTKEGYVTGTNFRIYLKNQRAGFIYSFGTDEKNELYPIYPYDQATRPFKSYGAAHITIPGEDSYIALTGSPGKDYLCILYSKELMNIDEIYDNLKDPEGTIIQNIRSQLSHLLPGPDVVSGFDNSIKYESEDPSSAAILFIIEISHI